MECHKLEKILHSYKEIYIYGAGIVAYGAYKALEGLWSIRASGFLVTERKGQPGEIDGIPVLATEESRIDPENSLILIATPEEYHSGIEQNLNDRSLFNYLKLDSHIEYALMGSYLKKVWSLNLVEDYEAAEGLKNRDAAGIYMAISHKDKALSKTYEEKSWIKKIQVGAVLTRERICQLTDINEDSISDQNALYGELTASYYGWKRRQYDITGLFHYRRILNVTEGQLGLLEKGILDVILPLPFVCSPDASGQYGRYLLPSDIDIMLEVIKERSREQYRETLDILKTPYLYNYNMLIARKETFEKYCDWLFPILEDIKNRCEREKRKRVPRYIGRIGEVLTSVYFMRNEKGWRIGHAEKVWRV